MPKVRSYARSVRTFRLSRHDDFDLFARISFVLSSIQKGPQPRRVNVSISVPAHYRSKRLVPLFTAHNRYYHKRLTLSTRHTQTSIASDDVYILASRLGACSPLSPTTMPTYQRSSSTWLSFRAILPPLVYQGLSHNKSSARGNDHYFSPSVAYPATHGIEKILTSNCRRRHTPAAVKD